MAQASAEKNKVLSNMRMRTCMVEPAAINIFKTAFFCKEGVLPLQ